MMCVRKTTYFLPVYSFWNSMVRLGFFLIIASGAGAAGDDGS